jgi:carboxylesterase type B
LPIVEGVKDERAFITEHPIKIVSGGKAHRVPLLIGHTTHEGLMSAAIFRRDPQALAKFESSLVPALKLVFGIENLNVGEIADKIHNFYLPRDANVDLDEKIRRYVDMLGDGFFNYDIHETVRNQRKFSPVYYYLNNNTNIPYIDWFLPEIPGELEQENIVGTVPPYYGVDHAADSIFYFPVDEVGMRITKGDKLYQYSKDLVNMVVQFAKDDTKMEFRGKKILPTPSEGPLKVTKFKTEEVVVSPEPFTDRIEFLRSLKIRP